MCLREFPSYPKPAAEVTVQLIFWGGCRLNLWAADARQVVFAYGLQNSDVKMQPRDEMLSNLEGL